jgi:cytochrome c peroxidase
MANSTNVSNCNHCHEIEDGHPVQGALAHQFGDDEQTRIGSPSPYRPL